MIDDDLANELRARPQRNATDWAAAAHMDEQAALIKELVAALDGALFLSDESGKVEAVRALIAKAKAVTG
jgi:hypothetical protein